MPHTEYVVVLTILGAAFLAAAILPRWLDKAPLTLPMFYVAAGLLVGTAWPVETRLDPLVQGAMIERLAELAVILSLMSAGLKIDRPLGWKSWQSTWRLLAITMPLCILALAWGGVAWLGLPLAGAVLLAASMAPTDPVLASDVQVGPPGEEMEDEPQFALTSEAGLNDGLAFPFVNLAIVLAVHGLAGEALAQWVLVDVIWKLLAGAGVGLVVGRVVAVGVFRFGRPKPVTDGFLALALTLFTYGVTELIHGYGFLAVFVAALAFRRHEKGHELHPALHAFSEQLEQLLMAVLLIGLGVAVIHGVLNPLGLVEVLVVLGFLIVVRPASGWIALAGTGITGRERAVIATYGIRGIGSVYYLAHGLQSGHFTPGLAGQLWAVAAGIVLASILLHGATATWAMRATARERAKRNA